MRRKPTTMTVIERLNLTAVIVFIVVLGCLGHATTMVLDHHWSAGMFAEFGVGFFLLWLLFIHFVRPQRPQ